MRTTEDISSPGEGIVTQGDGVVAPGVTIEWTSRNAWNTNNGEEGGDNLLMNGYIDNNAGTPEVTVDIAGLPPSYGNYDVIAYFGSDGNGRTGTIGIDGYDTYSYTTFSNQGEGFPEAYEQTTDTEDGNPESNYAIWEGVSGDNFSLLLSRGSSNSGIHGLQIIGRLQRAFEIVEVTRGRENGHATVTWTSADGETYAIESSRDLLEWEELDDGIPATGETTSFTDPAAAGSPESYYRVRIQSG
jgi:hypothetical protein